MGQLEIPSDYPVSSSSSSAESPVDGDGQLPTSSPSDGQFTSGSRRDDAAAAAGYNGCDPLWTPSQINIEQKLLHCAWHPLEDVVAVAGPLGLQMFRV